MKNFVVGLLVGALLVIGVAHSGIAQVSAATGPRVTGIGGVFFKAEDPKALAKWYRENLGLEAGYGNTTLFKWRELEQSDVVGSTVWGPFAKTTKYFRKEGAQWMLNFRVTQLDALLAELRKKGVTVEEKIESADYGRFAWIYDIEGNRVELWEPTATPPPTTPPTNPKEKP